MASSSKYPLDDMVAGLKLDRFKVNTLRKLFGRSCQEAGVSIPSPLVNNGTGVDARQQIEAKFHAMFHTDEYIDNADERKDIHSRVIAIFDEFVKTGNMPAFAPGGSTFFSSFFVYFVLWSI